MITPGITGRHKVVVTEELTAAHVGSGLAPVFATPMLVALMEQACAESVAPLLDEGQSTVGTHIDIAHSAATPMGMSVWCESRLIEVDRRRLTFSVKAYDEAGPVGEGVHERFIIDNAKFMDKVNGKKSAR